jgi:hypothetical protein
MGIKTILLNIFVLIFSQILSGQTVVNPTEASPISGSLQANGNFFIRDSAIGAANIPQYDRQLVGAVATILGCVLMSIKIRNC